MLQCKGCQAEDTQEVLKSISLQLVDKGDVNENLIEQDGKMLGFKDRRWALPFPALLLTPNHARTARYIHSWIKHRLNVLNLSKKNTLLSEGKLSALISWA